MMMNKSKILNAYFGIIALLFWNCNKKEQSLSSYEIATIYFENGAYDSCINILNSDSGTGMDSIFESKKYYLIGKAYSKMGQSQNAIINYKHSIDFNGVNKDKVYNDIGFELQNQGKYLESIDYFNIALKLNPINDLYFNNRGFSFLKIGSFESANIDFSRGLQTNIKNSAIYNNKGILFYTIGNWDSANFYFSKAIEIKPNYSEAIFSRANVFMILNKFNEAELDLNRIIETDTSFVDAYYYLGLIKLREKENIEACELFSKAISKGFIPSDSIYYKNCF